MHLLISILIFTISLNAFSKEKWTNFIGNQSCILHSYHEPKTLEELKQQIKNAASQGWKIHAIGKGHSLSDIGCTDGCLLNLKHLNKILSVNLEQKSVRVETGISLRDLNKQLAQHGLSLPNQPSIDQISVGGVLSTATHGTGHTGTLSSFIKEMELITYDGNTLNLSQNSHDEYFAAAKVSLGALGVIYSVVLQCEPLFYLKQTDKLMDIESILKNYKKIYASNDFFKFSWNIETGVASVTEWNRVNDTKDNYPPGYQALPWYDFDVDNKDLFSEIAVPFDLLPEALDILKTLFKKYQKLGAKIADITIRFVEQDKNSLLSPSFDGLSAYIALSIFEKDKYLAFYKEFENALRPLYGRPHWAKLNFLEKEQVMFLYGSNFEKFITVKRRLDPHGTFSNNFTKRIFGF